MCIRDRDKIARAASEAAAVVVRQLLKDVSGPEFQTAVVRLVCRQLQAYSESDFASIKIESAEPLSVDDQSALRDVLGDAAASAQFEHNAALGAGVRVRFDQGLIDASADGFAAIARRSLDQSVHQRSPLDHDLKQHDQ